MTKDPVNFSANINKEIFRTILGVAENNMSERLEKQGGKACLDVLKHAIRDDRPILFQEPAKELSQAEAIVYEKIRSGHTTFSELVENTSIAEKYVRLALKGLVISSKIEQENGEYMLTQREQQ